VGGTTADKARYSFSVPSSWKEDTVSKTEKGASGVDTRFLSGGRKKGTLYVVTLRSEGSREGIGFQAKDPDSALKSCSGSDYKLQDALAAGTLTSAVRTGAGGQQIFDYELDGPLCGAFSLLTAKDGRLFAIFVTAPAAAWAADKATFTAMRDSFKTYDIAA
jgi:hypothetical protein